MSSPKQASASKRSSFRRGGSKALTDIDIEVLAYDWDLKTLGRPKQRMPNGDWFVWLIQTGRGWGKTEAGAQTTRMMVEQGKAQRIALVGATSADVRDTMVEGPSGIMKVCPPWNRPDYEPSKRRLVWPNGAVAYLYSADEPERLRGPQHDWAWVDEAATFRRPAAWDNLLLGMRMGDRPRVMITTTPKPKKWLKAVLNDPRTHITTGSSYENRANLPDAFFEHVVSRYEGTTLGQQELYGRYLEDLPGAMLKRALHIDQHRVASAPTLSRIVVALDPSATNTSTSDEAGIVVAGQGEDSRFYILRDLTECLSPTGWGNRVLGAVVDWGADAAVAETNQGGDMVETVLRQCSKEQGVPMPRYIRIHAKKGKIVRSEPVVALYEQGKVSHVGDFPELEDQLCGWTPDLDWSPDRMDALVYALTELAYPGGPGEIRIGAG